VPSREVTRPLVIDVPMSIMSILGICGGLLDLVAACLAGPARLIRLPIVT